MTKWFLPVVSVPFFPFLSFFFLLFTVGCCCSLHLLSPALSPRRLFADVHTSLVLRLTSEHRLLNHSHLQHHGHQHYQQTLSHNRRGGGAVRCCWRYRSELVYSTAMQEKKKTGKIRQEMITQGTKSNGSRGLCCAKQETKYTTTPHSITHMKRVKRVRGNGIAGGEGGLLVRHLHFDRQQGAMYTGVEIAGLRRGRGRWLVNHKTGKRR